MLSKSQIKLIASLHQKKYRNKYGLFIVEGIKTVNEFLNSDFNLNSLYYTNAFSSDLLGEKSQLISENELKKISNLKTPNAVLALFEIPTKSESKSQKLKVVLDGVNDPGNLGTIIRLCDWFGIEDLICSKDTVDCFNAKVVQASMGSLTRVNVIYKDLVPFLNSLDEPIYGALMNGGNVYKQNLQSEGLLVMGNEANGISEVVQELITTKLTIPRFGNLQQTESLNVATAAAILLSEFSRS